MSASWRGGPSSGCMGCLCRTMGKGPGVHGTRLLSAAHHALRLSCHVVIKGLIGLWTALYYSIPGPHQTCFAGLRLPC